MLKSSKIIETAPEKIWPAFFNAKMDDRYPLAFRLGLPKPIECMIIEGDGKPGSIRRCVTTRGNMDQKILQADPYTQFTYELVDSTYWGQPFIALVRDEISLKPLGNNRTEVTRITHFNGKGGILSGIATYVMRLGFMTAHRYAYENWQRLALSN